MAQIANLADVGHPDYALQDFFPPLPVGDLATVVVIDSVPGLMGVVIANRFPTPPSALAFFTDYPLPEEGEYNVGEGTGFGPPYLLLGAVYPESDFLEPTIGQIWPRIG